MRSIAIVLAASLAASPALAAEKKRAETVTLPPEVTDGRIFDQLGSMVGALSRALLSMPIGEVEAAVENRPATRADQRRTVGQATGLTERELAAEVEQGKGAMKAGGQALARALPVMVEALNGVGEELERATANLPQPGYPRR